MNYEFKVESDKEMFSDSKDNVYTKLKERHIKLIQNKIREAKFKRKSLQESKIKRKPLKEMTISVISVDDCVSAINEIVSFITTRKPNINVSSDIISNAFINAIDFVFDDDTVKKKQFVKRILKFLVGYYKTL